MTTPTENIVLSNTNLFLFKSDLTNGKEIRVVGTSENPLFIGKDIAEEIVAKQPYSGIEDFLNRFGIDKRIVEPLIYLGAFKESPASILLEFYEEYKSWQKSVKDKQKRQSKRKDELIENFKSIIRQDKDLDSLLSHDNLMVFVLE